MTGVDRPAASRSRRLRALLRGVGIAYVPGLVERFPPVRVRLGPWVPAWSVRVAAAVVATGCLSLVSEGVANPQGVWTVFAVVAALLVLWPARLLPGLTVVAIGGLPVLNGTVLSAGQVAALILGLPLVTLLSALGGRVGLRARVEVATLGPVLRRLAIVQLVGQPVGLVAAALSGAPLGISLLPVLAIGALAVLVIGWLPTLDPAD